MSLYWFYSRPGWTEPRSVFLIRVTCDGWLMMMIFTVCDPEPAAGWEPAPAAKKKPLIPTCRWRSSPKPSDWLMSSNRLKWRGNRFMLLRTSQGPELSPRTRRRKTMRRRKRSQLFCLHLVSDEFKFESSDFLSGQTSDVLSPPIQWPSLRTSL